MQKITALIFGLVTIASLLILAENHLPPKSQIDGLALGGISHAKARQRLEEETQARLAQFSAEKLDRFEISNPLSEKIATISADVIRYQPDLISTLAEARGEHQFRLGQLGHWLGAIFSKPRVITTRLKVESAPLSSWLSEFAETTTPPSQMASIELKKSGQAKSLQIEVGEKGGELEVAASVQLIEDELNRRWRQQFGANGAKQITIDDRARAPLEAVVKLTQQPLTEAEVARARHRAELLVGRSLLLEATPKQFNHLLNDQALISLLALPQGVNEEALTRLLTSLDEKISVSPQEPRFEYDPETFKVKIFSPPVAGRELNREETGQKLRNYLALLDQLLPTPDSQNNFSQATTSSPVQAITTQSDRELTLPSSLELVITTNQPIHSLAETNELGINEVIGFGESHYDGSIPSRIENVSLATKKVSDLLLAPGKEFSFNQAIGDVSAASGFKPAYIIRNGMTELGDGGGVCQVSTTLFRAVLDAGLKVSRRLPHSYRVSYYELDHKPGIDATVFAGNVDLRFINDTNHYILIHGEAFPNSKYMNYTLYGTSDGRTTEIADHKTWGYSPPLPPVFIPDANLPPGKKQQVDWAASGIKASFTNIIRDANGAEIRRDTYFSSYRPWSAKYLVGVETPAP